MASGLRSNTVDRGRLPVQPRDRRAALSALALLLVVAGALGSALVVYRSGHRVDVLVASKEIKPGQQLSRDDFAIARVASDSGRLIPAGDQSAFIGSYTTVDVQPGTLLNPQMFLTSGIVPADAVIVGITLPQNQRPAVDLAQGDLVRVYELAVAGGGVAVGAATGSPSPAGSGPAPAAGAKVLVDVARVVETATTSTSNGDGLEVSLLLKASDAQAVIADNATGQIAVGRLPVTSTPGIDLRSAATATPTPAA